MRTGWRLPEPPRLITSGPQPMGGGHSVFGNNIPARWSPGAQTPPRSPSPAAFCPREAVWRRCSSVCWHFVSRGLYSSCSEWTVSPQARDRNEWKGVKMDEGESHREAITLFIKSPNQAQGDQTVEGVCLNWTVKDLKTHLSTVYPGEPVSSHEADKLAG